VRSTSRGTVRPICASTGVETRPCTHTRRSSTSSGRASGQSSTSARAHSANLTTEGLLDGDVSVGDRFRVGTAELVVTQPRLPCFKLGIKMIRDAFVTEFLERGLYGFYLAVAREGQVEAGDPIVELRRDPRGFRVAEIARLYARDLDDIKDAQRAADLDVLPESWRNRFRKRIYGRAA
jgi:MOSC domain-containing protein YiiM